MFVGKGLESSNGSADLDGAFPAAFRGRFRDAALSGENPVAWLSLDLDGNLRFASGLVVLTDRRLLSFPPAENGSSAKDVLAWSLAETTALGAAYAAGLAVGFWAEVDELRDNWIVDRTWSPGIDSRQREQLHAMWLKAVERSLGWM